MSSEDSKLERAAEPVLRTFFFSDIVGSTAIRDAYIRRHGEMQGNEKYRQEILVPHDRRVKECFRSFDGEVINGEGDSYFVAFPDARQAVQCAVSIQESLVGDPIPVTVVGDELPRRVQVRIGMHTGTAAKIERGGRLNYDDHAINIAHRIQEHAAPDQILTSRETLKGAGEIEGVRGAEHAGYRLKGVTEVFTLVEVLWGGHEPQPPIPRADAPAGVGTQPHHRPAAVQRLSDRRAERRHCDRVIRAHETVNIPGRTKPLSLEQIYIALRVGGYVPAQLWSDEVARPASEAGSAAHAEVIDAVEALRRKPHHLVVLGEPGGGKTTLLKHLALQIAKRDPAFGDWAREVVRSHRAVALDRIQRRLVGLAESIQLWFVLLGLLALMYWGVIGWRSWSRLGAFATWAVLLVTLLVPVFRYSRRALGLGTAVGAIVLATSAHFALVPVLAITAMAVAFAVMLYPYWIAPPVRWLTRGRDRLTRYPLPMYLTLNDVGRTREPLEMHLARMLEPAGFADPEGYLARALGDGECLVLLDALDEVMEESAYRWTAAEIAKFAGRWERVPVVVTCRTAAFREERALLPEFRRVEMQEFTEAEVERFVRSWFDVAAGGAPGRADGLRQGLARNPRMRQLAANPLLLSLMCLSYELDLRLPDRRVELYQRCADELLEKIERVRDLAGRARFTPDVKRQVLRAIAGRFHEAGVQVFSEGPLLDAIETALRELGHAGDRPDDFLREVMERSGLLRQQSRTSYGFAHLTWQEFFAAEDLRRRGAASSLLDRISVPWWREVILLHAGLEPDPADVVRRLTEQDLLLGAAALADAADPGTEAFTVVRHEILTQLETRMAEDSACRQSAADALAALGRWGASERLVARARDREHPEVGLAAMLALDHAGDRAVLATLCEPLGPVLQLLVGHLGRAGDDLEPRILVLLDRLGCPLAPVGAGEFVMGDDAGPSNERPAHIVRLERYWMGKHPVTNALYGRFCAEAKHEARGGSEDAARADHPVVNVSWHDAVAFCRWSETQLPSEAEWEKAARGSKGRRYPWGEQWEAGRCNVGSGGTSAVGEYSRDVSPYGCFDLAGNVSEWTRSLYRAYPYEAADGRESMDAVGPRVLRGGAFHFGASGVRCAVRNRSRPSDRVDSLGFRVAVSPFASEP